MGLETPSGRERIGLLPHPAPLWKEGLQRRSTAGPLGCSNPLGSITRLRAVERTRWGGVLAGVLSGFLVSSCRVADAKVWNLQQVHEPDGTPRRVGRVQSDFGFLLQKFFELTNFSSQEMAKAKEKEIEDPLGECLENLLELEGCDQRKPKVQAAMVETYAWLAVDCTYVLSRERCTIELGDLARALEVEKAEALPSDAVPATPEQIGEVYDDLVSAAQPFLLSRGGSVRDLEEACDATSALVLDRAGALRLLRACNVLLARGGGQELEPLSALRLDLARRNVAQALAAVLEDEEGRVRAAGLAACVRLPEAERAELLRWALVDEMSGVRQRELVARTALDLLARDGLPPPPESLDAEARAGFERVWIDLLIQVLQNDFGGMLSTSACKALAKISGRPLTVRPESWIEWWRLTSPPPASAGEARGE